MIYTFYSYKGGVGRSMALANIAELFYRAGLKVLMIDWDLEAPGLEQFFPIDYEDFYTKPGLMDLLLEYKRQMSEEDLSEMEDSDELPFQKPQEFFFDIYPDSESKGTLWLLSAGKRSKNDFNQYIKNVNNFDWIDFYKTWEGERYFNWLSEQFKAVADVIFIDSRTGLSEMGRVCAYQFTDVIVMLTTASQQSLDGTLQMLREFRSPKVKEVRGYVLDVIVVPARVEYSESNYLDSYQEEFIELFKKHIPQKLGSRPDRLWQLCIPYVPKYAYKERLAIPEKDKEHAKKLVDAFSKLASALSVLADDASLIRQAMPETQIKLGQETVTKIQVNPDIFVIDNNNTYIESKPHFSDWGNAPDVNIFLGRAKELNKLEKWIIQDRCRMVAILGMGGIGKTNFSLKLAQNIHDEFDYVIWRSLINAPPVNEILMEIIKYLSNQEVVIENNLDHQLSQLLSHLRSNRCLLILDNIETILQGGEKVGQYRNEYQNYGQFFKLVGETLHQSCLLLTSREVPPEIDLLAGDKFLVRSWELRGLNFLEGQEYFNIFGKFFGQDEEEWQKLIEFYDGNPLALELAARYVNEEFSGNITNFLREGLPVFAGLKDLLDWHFNRLSEDEKQILYWLAINRESISVEELIEDVINQQQNSKVRSNIQSLRRRFPLAENQDFSLTVQPVILEYLTEKLIDEVCQEVETGEIKLFNNHALIKATAKDYIRNTQIRLILTPIIDKLLTIFNNKNSIENQFIDIILKLRGSFSLQSGYAAGNILNLLREIKVDLIDYDFSGLVIRQAYLQDMELHKVNFKNSTFTNAVFTEYFSSVLSVAFHPDGKILATGDADGEIHLWSAGNLQPLLRIKAHSSWVRSVAFSPDGNVLASGSDDQLVKLWNTSKIETLKTIKLLRPPLKGHTYRVRSVAFKPGGSALATSSYDKTVKLWDINTGKCIKTFEGHDDWVWTAEFSPDGTQLVSSGQDGKVKIWDIATGESSDLLSDERQQIQTIAFSFDGEILACGSDDKMVKLWNFKTGEYLKSLIGHTDYVRAVAFNREGILASASYDNKVRLWDIKTGECTQVFAGHTHRLRAIAFSPNGKNLVSGGWDQILKLRDISKGDKSLRTSQGRTDWICAADISPDGKRVVSGSDDKTVNLWDVDKENVSIALNGHKNWVWAVAFSPDQQTVASGSFDKTIKIWSLTSGKCLHTLTGHKNWVWAVAYSPDGKFVASASDDKAVKMWNIRTGESEKDFPNNDSEWVRSVAFSPDGQILASGSDDGKVRLWNINNSEQTSRTLEGHNKRVRSIAFSPDNQTLASGSYDQTIKIWDVKTGNCLKTLEGHDNQVRSVAFRRDGEILASGGNDGTVRLWNAGTGKCFRVLRDHTDEVRSVAFSRKADILISCSKDGTIRLWDAISGDFIKILRKQRLYEGMNITGITGLSDLQKASLTSLGAVEED